MVLDALQVSVPRDSLAETVATVSRALSSRQSVLVLGGIRLRAEGDDLTLAATDMEISLRGAISATVSAAGEVVVPGRLLLEISRALPAADALLEYVPEEAVLTISSGTAHYRINTFPAEDFPQLPDLETLTLRPIDRAALVGTINRVRKSASRDESRPVLTGILVRFEADSVVMAATDSYRLAVKQTPCRSPIGELEAIIPARALEELARIAGGAEEIQLGMHDNHAVFGVGGVWLTTRRIDGQFPNYRQLMPDRFEHELVLPREELLDVVRRVGLLAQRNSPLRLRFSEGELAISAQTQDVGQARESLPAPYHGAEPLEIGFNADFLREGLDSIESAAVRFKLISPLRPAVLEGETADYAYLIMPIRLAG
jgi:DNA polymerase-3 subunit beta